VTVELGSFCHFLFGGDDCLKMGLFLQIRYLLPSALGNNLTRRPTSQKNLSPSPSPKVGGEEENWVRFVIFVFVSSLRVGPPSPSPEGRGEKEIGQGVPTIGGGSEFNSDFTSILFKKDMELV
jgi:hypothetical protein